MTTLQKSQLAGVLRFLATGIGMALVTHHVLSKKDVSIWASMIDWQAVAAAVPVVGSLVWGFIQKHQANTSLFVAASTGQTDATPTKGAMAAVVAAMPSAQSPTFMGQKLAPPVAAPDNPAA